MNTEYCICAMKTLVYELSNCLVSAWKSGSSSGRDSGGIGDITMSLLLSDDFIIFCFSTLFFGSIVKGERNKNEFERQLKTIPISRLVLSFSSPLLLVYVLRQLRKYTLFCAAYTHTHALSKWMQHANRTVQRIECIFACPNGHSQLYSHSSRPQQLCPGRLNSHLAAMNS